MDCINLEEYIGCVEVEKQCSAIVSNLAGMKYNTLCKPSDFEFCEYDVGNICKSRVELACNQLNDRYNNQRYTGSCYLFDKYNELERIKTSNSLSKYIYVISFEDSLDFIFCCLYKSKQGSLIDFCYENNLSYINYSRCLLGGGHCGELYITDLYGFSSGFDYEIKKIGSDNSVEKKLFYTRLSKFCYWFRNALMSVLNTSLCVDGDTMLISAGASSLVYNSNKPMELIVHVKYKIYETKLKMLCMKDGEYLNSLHKCLSC